MIKKQVLDGTHRSCPPEETLARIAPVLPQVGITRIADITGLDTLGIPVYQAVRPNGRTLSVSQGKGVTPALAKASACMEAIEMWHAEEFDPPVTKGRWREIAPSLPYDPQQLSLCTPSFLHPGTMLEWVEARVLLTGETTYVPRELVTLDATLRMRPCVPLFRSSSNGLASGNVMEEAVLHGLYEVVERDSLTYWRDAGSPEFRHLNPDTIRSATCRRLLGQFSAAGVTPVIFDATGPSGIPCFHVAIHSPDLPETFSGFGCHLDPEVALLRALTESAQSRAAVIAGARDELNDASYAWVQRMAYGVNWDPLTAEGSRHFDDIPSLATDDLAADLIRAATLVRQQTGFSPMVADLTRASLGVPVAFVLAPGLQFRGVH